MVKDEQEAGTVSKRSADMACAIKTHLISEKRCFSQSHWENRDQGYRHIALASSPSTCTPPSLSTGVHQDPGRADPVPPTPRLQLLWEAGLSTQQGAARHLPDQAPGSYIQGHSKGLRSQEAFGKCWEEFTRVCYSPGLSECSKEHRASGGSRASTLG